VGPGFHLDRQGKAGEIETDQRRLNWGAEEKDVLGHGGKGNSTVPGSGVSKQKEGWREGSEGTLKSNQTKNEVRAITKKWGARAIQK